MNALGDELNVVVHLAYRHVQADGLRRGRGNDGILLARSSDQAPVVRAGILESNVDVTGETSRCQASGRNCRDRRRRHWSAVLNAHQDTYRAGVDQLHSLHRSDIDPVVLDRRIDDQSGDRVAGEDLISRVPATGKKIPTHSGSGTEQHQRSGKRQSCLVVYIEFHFCLAPTHGSTIRGRNTWRGAGGFRLRAWSNGRNHDARSRWWSSE